ncbi:MAG: glycogen synthase GlgA [Termitinemataceae bacterium]|nr:MAG: glycogen synthase GlgA [Termitinemataceae bacterium]
MKILMCSSEVMPFAKTGGLADAVGSLSLSLAKLGHDVKVVMPRYYSIDKSKFDLEPGAMGVPMGGIEEWCGVFKTKMPGSTSKNPVWVYFIDHEIFFGRDGFYGTPSDPDFADNPRRFAFFSRSVFQLCHKIQWFPEILHAHDWPSAPVCAYLKYGLRFGPFEHTSSILTIHNLGYQGSYHKDNFGYLGLGWNVYYEGGFEDWDKMNMLKAGIYCADKLNTVSVTYCEETKRQESGFMLDGPLRYRSNDYRGILNGVDTDVWNPKTDKYIPKTYSVDDLSGKAEAKLALQKEFGLQISASTPIIGMVSRLASQKGVGALFGPGHGSAYSICADMDLQFVLLGTGESWCETEVLSLSSRLPNFRARIGYSEKICHLIEAGSDFFMMPSVYEPCGLNQMYSLNYGTLPIVRRTGGLADTVENYDPKTGSGSGFMLDYLSPGSIYDTVSWANWTYHTKIKDIEAMRLRGMKLDFSWENSAQKYVDMYKSCLGQGEDKPVKPKTAPVKAKTVAKKAK